MPRGDRSGPDAMGPMTGRRAGYCAGFGAPGFMNRGPGMGLGRGRGFGQGRGMGFGFGQGNRWGGQQGNAQYAPNAYPAYPGPTPDQEAGMLKDQADYLERELKDIKDRLSELDSEKSDK